MVDVEVELYPRGPWIGWRLPAQGEGQTRANGHELQYTFDAAAEETGVAPLLKRLGELGVGYRDLNTRESSLEEIFVSLVGRGART